jgi:hypothetical protein
MKSSIPDWDHVIKSEVHSSLDEAPLSKEIALLFFCPPNELVIRRNVLFTNINK